VRTDLETFPKTAGVTGVDDWRIREARFGQRSRYGCPKDVFEHEDDRLVKAPTIIAGEREAGTGEADLNELACGVRRYRRRSGAGRKFRSS